MRIYAIEINNLSIGMHCGGVLKQGCLNLKVDRLPAKRIYKRYGNIYVSNTGGIWSYFQHSPGTTRGFAGRTIVLPVVGEGKVFKNKGLTYKTFKGDLWDTSSAHKKAEELAGGRLMHVGIRAANDRLSVYCSYCVSFDEIVKKLGHLIICDTPTMNKEIHLGDLG